MTASRLFRLVLLGILTLSTTGRAQNATEDCLGPYEEDPPAGEWTGQLRLVYQIGARREITYTIEGDLSFELARVPLINDGPTGPTNGVEVARAKPGQFANDDEQRAAIFRWYAEHPPDPIPVGGDDTITGTATIRQQGKLQTPSSSGNFSLRSPATTRVEAKEESRDSGPPRFQALKLSAETVPWMTGTVTSQFGSSATANADGSITGRDRRGRQVTTPPPLPTPGPSGPAIELSVDRTSCVEMAGGVDPVMIRRAVAGSGIGPYILESSWSASYTRRDPDFEARVDALAAEPIPANITLAYLDRFQAAWAALRGEAQLSSYRRCILRKLEHKSRRILLATVRSLLDNYPRARDGATCADFRAALLRIVSAVKQLQVFGLKCPLVSEWQTIAGREVAEALERARARSAESSELNCLAVANADLNP
jgi:hypothetical protein